MMSDALVVPARLAILGQAFKAAAERFARKAAAPSPLADRVVEMRDVLPAHFSRLQGSAEMLCREIQRLSDEVVTNSEVSEAQVLAAVVQFERELAQIAELLVTVRGLRVDYHEEEGKQLLAGVYQHLVQQILAWMRELAATLANPQEALRKRGLPASGDSIEIPLTLTLTLSEDFYALRDWIESRGRIAPPREREESIGLLAKLGWVMIGWSLLS